MSVIVIDCLFILVIDHWFLKGNLPKSDLVSRNLIKDSTYN